MSYTELRLRLSVAWRVLCGWGVVHGVVVSGGDVKVANRSLLIAPKAGLRGCHITTEAENVILINPGPGNTGQAAVAQSMREARWMARRMHRT